MQGNAISDNTGDGVMLVNARKLTIGGNSAVNGDGIVSIWDTGFMPLACARVRSCKAT